MLHWLELANRQLDRLLLYDRLPTILLWSFAAVIVFLPGVLLCESSAPRYRVVVDPGHGGAPGRAADDKWDAVTGSYLDVYRPGMVALANGRTYQEHLIALELGRRLQHYLDLTRSEAGWRNFVELLTQFSAQRSFQRIIIDSSMSREDSWNHRFRSADHPEVNAAYRLYDYPDPDTGHMEMGRISYMNSLHPHMVVSLHCTPAGPGRGPGGMAAVIAPGFPTFDLIRQIHLGQKPQALFDNGPWNGRFLVTDAGWTQFEAARADAWVYFNGYRTNRQGTAIDRSKNRGIRYNMFQWRYRDPPGWEVLYNPDEPGPYALDFREFRAEGPFWDREKAQPELWRREGGPLGYGGDNYYASDELLRFVQFGLRRLVPALRANNAIGPINQPFVSTYSVPTFINAISAYLEIAYLDRQQDRVIMIEHTDAVAKSLAVGIYSLFVGLELNGNYGPFKPRGEALGLEKYENLPQGNYFELVTD